MKRRVTSFRLYREVLAGGKDRIGCSETGLGAAYGFPMDRNDAMTCVRVTEPEYETASCILVEPEVATF